MTQTTDHETLFDMFRFKRPSGSQTEIDFVDRFLLPLGFTADLYGNMWLQIGEDPRVLFSSHFDTVHHKGGFQNLKFDGTHLTSDSNCLGADDTAGVWLMTEMVKNKIPGLYVIHYGEERGCIGSRALAKNKPEFFQGIDIAIAFDRAYYEDIITHQVGRRTASDAFALSLASQLGGEYKPSPNGVFTDTNEYSHLVAECTNVSVGYSSQHSAAEKQDVPFLIALRDSLLNVDWDQLVVERDPNKEEYSERDWRPSRRQPDYQDLILDYPDIVEEILRANGITKDMFEECVEDYYGVRSAA